MNAVGAASVAIASFLIIPRLIWLMFMNLFWTE